MGRRQAATTGRRGPGQPGSARTFPGESASPAASFGPGMTLDVLAGCAGLAVAADAAAGEDARFGGVSEAELIGVLCAWDRMEAHAHARKLAAVSELARRNPGELDAEFTAHQVACALGESRACADSLIGMAQTLPTHLPGTAAALENGTISRYKAEVITRATALLDDDEAARLTIPEPGPGLIITIDSITTDPCDHRHENSGHDAGVKLRHLSQIRHATCTSPVCRRPAAQCDLEHNTPYEAGGRTCLCNIGPLCKR